MIRIAQPLLEQLIGYCRSRLPSEACGALLGHAEAGRLTVTAIVPMANRAAEPERAFLLDPKQWVALQYRQPHENGRLIGVFHSHPRTEAVPSAEDSAGAWRCLPSYWIVSFADPDKPEIRAYRPTNPLAAAEQERPRDRSAFLPLAIQIFS